MNRGNAHEIHRKAEELTQLRTDLLQRQVLVLLYCEEQGKVVEVISAQFVATASTIKQGHGVHVILPPLGNSQLFGAHTQRQLDDHRDATPPEQGERLADLFL